MLNTFQTNVINFRLDTPHYISRANLTECLRLPNRWSSMEMLICKHEARFVRALTSNVTNSSYCLGREHCFTSRQHNWVSPNCPVPGVDWSRYQQTEWCEWLVCLFVCSFVFFTICFFDSERSQRSSCGVHQWSHWNGQVVLESGGHPNSNAVHGSHTLLVWSDRSHRLCFSFLGGELSSPLGLLSWTHCLGWISCDRRRRHERWVGWT